MVSIGLSCKSIFIIMVVSLPVAIIGSAVDTAAKMRNMLKI